MIGTARSKPEFERLEFRSLYISLPYNSMTFVMVHVVQKPIAMKLLKILGVLVLVLVVVVAGALTYVSTALPDVGPPPEITVEITPERLERGEYLANHVMLCMDCHSTRDWS